MNESPAKINYVGEFSRLKIHSLTFQREKKENVLNWRSNIACLAVGIHWTDHGSILAVKEFYACMNLVKFIFKSFVSCNLQFQANSTVYRSIFRACRKPRPGQVDFPFGQGLKNFLSFLARWARTQASRSPAKFLLTILRWKGKL